MFIKSSSEDLSGVVNTCMYSVCKYYRRLSVCTCIKYATLRVAVTREMVNENKCPLTTNRMLYVCVSCLMFPIDYHEDLKGASH